MQGLRSPKVLECLPLGQMLIHSERHADSFFWPEKWLSHPRGLKTPKLAENKS